jgi:hypothetical protein
VRGRWQEALGILEGGAPVIAVALQVIFPSPHIRQHGSQLGDLLFEQLGDALWRGVLERCRLRWRERRKILNSSAGSTLQRPLSSRCALMVRL